MDFHGGDGVASKRLRRAAGVDQFLPPAFRLGERGISQRYFGKIGTGEFHHGEDECGGAGQRLRVAWDHHHRASALLHRDGSIICTGRSAAGPRADSGEHGGGPFKRLFYSVFTPAGLNSRGRGGVCAIDPTTRSRPKGQPAGATCSLRSESFPRRLEGRRTELFLNKWGLPAVHRGARYGTAL